MNLERFWHGSLRRPYKLYATSHGDMDKPVIVLLHGIAASGEDWGKLIPLLTPHYRCITIDLLGFGTSPKPQWAGYTMAQHVHSLHRTIRALRLSDPFVLVGHSLGSLLAASYTRQYPGNINRLLLLSPPVYPPLTSIESKMALYRTSLLMRLYRFLRSHPRMTPDNIRRLSYIVPLPRSIVKYPETWVPFKRTLERCIEQQSIQQDIRGIRTPIDIFYGSLDTVVIGQNVHALARLKDVQVHTFAGNHALGRTYAKVVAKLLTA